MRSDPLAFLQDGLRDLEARGLLRSRVTVEGPQGATLRIGGREVVNFSSNDYLGLASHPALVAAAKEALDRYGVGSGASRLITGDTEAHRALEQELADLKGTEAVLVFNSGYHANTGIIPALVGEGDVVFSDALNHASLIDGCRLAKAERVVYRHVDPEDLESHLRRHRTARRKLIVTDALFSMDGDLAPLPELCEIAERHGALLMVDEAHATGVFGPRGAGVAAHFGVTDRVQVHMGTLGKALGAFGAYVAGRATLVEWLFNRARSFVFTTGLPPTVCAAARAAVTLPEGEVLRGRLWANVAYLKRGLEALGFEASASPSQIVPLVLGDARRTMEASDALKARGLWVQGIRPPTVPEGTSRLRITVMATHSQAHLDRLLEGLGEVLGSRRRAGGARA
ncbi:MAG: 8-amino-7-oxononanoate synthase [Deltaproteobacteria bacterium]|nr:MAG: 8-amino-7-oxononanoate synthase [Deltaproteobacteria bacterium]